MGRYTVVCLCTALYCILYASVILQRANGHIQFFFHNYYSATIYTDIFEKSVNAESGVYESYHHYGQAGIFANSKSIFEHEVNDQPNRFPATVFKYLAETNATEVSCRSKMPALDFAKECCNIREIAKNNWLLVLRSNNFAQNTEHPAEELRYGYGDPHMKGGSAYFIGLEKLHQLTKRFDMSLLAATKKLTEHSEWEHELATEFYVASREADYQISYDKQATAEIFRTAESQTQKLWSKGAYRDLLNRACPELSFLKFCELYIRPQ